MHKPEPTPFVNFTQYRKAEDLKRLKFICEQVQKHCAPGARILDVGCGNGNITFQLANMGYSVTGIDVSHQTILKARKIHPHPQANFQPVAAEELAEHGEKYDAVVCSEVIEHLHRPELLVNYFPNLVKDKGLLLVTVPNGYGPRESLVTKPMQYLQTHAPEMWKSMDKFKKSLGYAGTSTQSDASDLSHVQFFTRKNLSSLIQDRSFELVHFKPANFVEGVFPYSILTTRVKALQDLDCWVANYLPVSLSSGFYTAWKKGEIEKANETILEPNLEAKY